MAPKRTKTKAQAEPKKTTVKNDSPTEERQTEPDTGDDQGSSENKQGSKRKSTTESKAKPVKKAKKAKEDEEEPTADPSPLQLLRYLISPASLSLCRPTDEAKELEKTPQKEGYKTYSGSTLTPFEELLSAVILSRPISHALGHRSIRTILNPPYNFNTPKAIQKAGMKKAHQSMFDARTQHKEKTANEIVQLADVVAEKFGGAEDTSLEEVQKQADYDINKESELLKSSIHGIGPTGLNIFFRRVQWLWTQRFPFMDERTCDAAAALGLPDDADELFGMVEEAWNDLKTEHLDGKDEDERKRRAYVVLLERLIGAHLEKKINKVLVEAEKVEV